MSSKEILIINYLKQIENGEYDFVIQSMEDYARSKVYSVIGCAHNVLIDGYCQVCEIDPRTGKFKSES